MAAKNTALADAYEENGQTPQAVDAAQAALSVTRADATLVPAARLFGRTGREAAASAIATELDKQLQPQSRAYAKLIEAELALNQGRPVDAIEKLETARKLADLWLVRFDLGRAYLDAGHYAEAVSEFEGCLKRRGEATALFLDDVPTFRYLAQLPYWTARAYEGIGAKTSAQKNYTAFLALRPASPDNPLVIDARRRSAAL
jgi:tetratricopeptide (TPR) repeat protein